MSVAPSKLPQENKPPKRPTLQVATQAVPVKRRETFIKKFRRKKLAVASGIYLILLLFASLFVGFLTPYDPNVGVITDRLQPIGTEGHILGTDELGRDILTRILYGARLSLLAGILPVLFAVMIGGGLGIVAGYYGGKIGTIIMRTLDIFYAFPAFLLAIGISAALGSSLTNVILSLGIVFIAPIARVAESAVKKVVNMEFIEAARASGAGTLSIIVHHVLKNVFSPIFVYASTQIGICIVMAAGLSFLGLGVSPPTPEWGFMLNSLKDMIYVSPILTVVPGVFIFLTALAFNLISDGIRDSRSLN